MKYFISRTGEKPKDNTPILEVGTTLLTGFEDFSKYFGKPTTLEEDLLLLAAAVFAADRATKRGEREDFCRQIELEIPIFNIAIFNGVVSQIEQLLRLLSNDAWKLTIRSCKGKSENYSIPKDNGGKTLLFSGGLDSLAGAIIEGKGKTTLELVSHITHNSKTSGSQNALAELLKTKKYNINHRKIFVSSRTDEDFGVEHSEEASQRTRSFLFMAIGSIIARRTGNRKVLLMAENGQMAIHLPLTQGRIGAFSTHTAHPDVLSGAQDIFSNILSTNLIIANPFVGFTKKEVVEIICASIPESIPISTSCFRNWRLPAGATHCGECIPCFIRKIAIESLCSDKTAYNRNIWREDISKLSEDDEGGRNLMDLLEFITFLSTSSNEEIMSEYPELYSKHIDAISTIKMYKRFCSDAKNVLKKYPFVWSIIGEDIS